MGAPHRRRDRLTAGVTLLELLVVIVILAIATSIVAPMLVAPPATDSAASDASDGSAAAPIVAAARRTAIRRAEPLRLRLRVDHDGVWALVSTRTGETIDGGRALAGNVGGRIDAATDAAVDMTIDVTIDPLGSCLPAGAMVRRGAGETFDALHCTRSTAPSTASGSSAAIRSEPRR